jgi:hypothetical protein
MFHRGFRFAEILALLFCTTCFCVQLQAQRCGKERWAVKTGTDAGAGSVGLASPQNTTIAQLIGLTPPSPIPADSRFGPTENTVFVVNATLTDYKLEGGSKGDSDYHLVLQDDQGKTMVAEIPSPGCVGDGSPFAAQIASARAAFDAQFTATTSFQTANVPVQVTGVGFFDFAHGQHGAAPNVIELHPVLNIAFNPLQNPSDFTLSMAPSTINMIQGGSSSTTINTAMTGAATGAPTLTVSSTPTGISTQITPTGPGKATLSLMATQAAATGSFPLTITGTANGRSHSLTAQLNVSPFSASPGTQQWEYKMITASSEQDVVDQANALGAQDWELVSVVKIQGNVNTWKAFFKRLKNNF